MSNLHIKILSSVAISALILSITPTWAQVVDPIIVPGIDDPLPETMEDINAEFEAAREARKGALADRDKGDDDDGDGVPPEGDDVPPVEGEDEDLTNKEQMKIINDAFEVARERRKLALHARRDARKVANDAAKLDRDLVREQAKIARDAVKEARDIVRNIAKEEAKAARDAAREMREN